MKFTGCITSASLSMLFIINPVFAGNDMMADKQPPTTSLSNVLSPDARHCESKGINLPSSERNALILSCLSNANSSENVRAVALQQKILNCTQNAKNKHLQGSKLDGYLTTCIYKNEALLALEALTQRFASTDINEMLRQSPTAAGK